MYNKMFYFITDLPDASTKKSVKNSSVKKKFSKNIKKCVEDSVSL